MTQAVQKPHDRHDVAMSVLQVNLLGGFRLAYGSKLVTSINTPRLQSLLAYLVLHRNAPQSRRHLAFLFWPDSAETQARTNLRHLLHELMRALPNGARYLLSDTQTVQWQPQEPCTVDVVDFESAVAAGGRTDLERSADLYGGDLLPGCYEDWIAPERERLRWLCISALERLLDLAEADRDYQQAVSYGSRLLERDPCREGTYRSLMRLHALRGDRAAALHTYHTCVTTLRRELGVPPDAATRTLHEQLLNAERTFATAAPPHAAEYPLVGRAVEWAHLQALWRRAAAGRPHLALLTGEPGIGKTRLAEELASWASRQGILTASARAYFAEGELPYAPVAAWLRARSLPALEQLWLTELARLLPELLTIHPDLPHPEPLQQDWQRSRLFEALVRGLLGSRSPRLLILDDLQWCDQDTLGWLGYLLRFAPRAPLLILGTLRTGESLRPELRELLAALRHDDLITDIELGPLDAPQTAALATSVAERTISLALAESLYRGSEGNPLFVVEIVQAGLVGGTAGGPDAWAVDHAGAEREAPQPLPRKVRQVLDRRLGQLSPGAREVAELAATIGRQFTFDVLAAASEATDGALVSGLDELWERRIIREQESGYDFSHDKIREAVYAGLSLARRRLLHRSAARALETVYAGDLSGVRGHIARHYEQAGQARLAVTYYCRAAESAREVYANAEAIHYYRRAIVLLGSLPGQEPAAADLWEQLGDLLHLTCQHEPALAAYRQGLVVAAGPATRAGLLRKSGNVSRDRRQYEDSHRAYADAAAMLGDTLPQETAPAHSAQTDPRWWHEWIELQIDRVHLQYWENETQAARGLLDQMSRLIEQHGTAFQRLRYAIWSSMILLRSQRFVPSDATTSYLRSAETVQAESALAINVPFISFQLGFLHLWHGALERADAYLRESLSLAERSGDLSLEARCLTYRALIARRLCREEQVRGHAEVLLDIAQRANMPEYLGAGHANYAWLAWRGGDAAAALSHGRSALEHWSGLPFRYAFQWQALWPLLAASVQVNQVDAALEYAHLLLDPSQQHIPENLLASLELAVQTMTSGQARGSLQIALQLAQAEGLL